MVSWSLLLLWGDTSLEENFRLAVSELLSGIVTSALEFKVLFHKVDVLFVVLEFDPRVFPNQDSIVMKTLGNLLALFKLGLLVSVEVDVNVNDWNFL
jgi:hypothetical protein